MAANANGEFKGWTKATIENLIKDVEEIKGLLMDHNGACTHRIDKLENWKSWITGGLALLGVALVVVVAVLG